MAKKDEKQRRRNELLCILLSMAVGVIMCVSSFLFRPHYQSSEADSDRQYEENVVKLVLLSVGSSVLASSVVILINYFFGADVSKDVRARIDELEETISDESIVLKNKNRKHIEEKGYYDTIYNRADTIRICGVQLSSVVAYICRPTKHSDHWVRRLFERKYVSVNLLMAHPDSVFSPNIERQVPGWNLPGEIRATVSKLKCLADDYATRGRGSRTLKPLAKGSRINLYLTRRTIPFSIANSSNLQDMKNDIMLFGLLLNTDTGPIYRIRRDSEVDTYDEIQKYFDSLIEGETPVFVWDDQGIRFNDAAYEDSVSQKPRQDHLRAV